MAKKKKGKGKGGGKKAPKIIDGLSTNEMSPVQLLGHIKRLQAEIEREREERNFFMLEREKLFTLWNLAVEQLSEEKQKARLLDAQMEQSKKDTKSEMDLHKQKLRFLQSEQSKKLGLVRLNHLEKMKKVQDEVWAIQNVMKETLEAKKKQLRNSQVSLYELLRRMQLEHSETTSNMRKQFGSEIRRIEMNMDRQLLRDREIAELEAKAEMAKIIQLKDEQLEKMLTRHEKKVLEMKTFFNDLTVNNFAVVTSLQQDIINKKITEQRLRRELKASKERYFSLLTPVKHMEQKLVEWEEQDFNIKKVQAELSRGKAQLEKNQRYTRMLECANEALNQRLELIKEENEVVKQGFTKEVLDMQKKCSMKRLVLAMKLRAIKQETAMFKALIESKMKGYEFGTSGAPGGVEENETVETNPIIEAFLRKQEEALIRLKENITATKTQLRSIAEGQAEKDQNPSLLHPNELNYMIKLSKGLKKKVDMKKPEVKKIKRHTAAAHSSSSKSSKSSLSSKESSKSKKRAQRELQQQQLQHQEQQSQHQTNHGTSLAQLLQPY